MDDFIHLSVGTDELPAQRNGGGVDYSVGAPPPPEAKTIG